MINLKIWKKSLGYDKPGFDKVKSFLLKKGAIVNDEWDGDLYADIDFDVSSGMSIKKIEKELKEKFPDLADVEYSSSSKDYNEFDSGERTNFGNSLNISFNERTKVEKKGVPN